MAPTSQKAGERPISFILTDQSGITTSVSLVIRPEDLTRVEPSRLSVQQTLGGAWVDNFGPGISTINISGHTGWRGGFDQDGVESFKTLRDQVFVQWHALRNQSVRDGKNPDVVKLVYADALDDIAVSVAPGQFVLKRNRARPLLMMYQISMTVLADDVAPVTAEDESLGDMFPAGIDSLTDSLRRLEDAAAQVRGFIDATIIGPVEGLLDVANTAMSRVLDVVGTGDRVIVGQAAQLISFARDIAQVGRNAFYTYNAVVNQPDVLRIAVSEVASAFDNAFCVLSNVFKISRLYPDYSDLYGASNCSSTSGGSPLSPWRLGNAFDHVTPQFSAPLSVTPLAQTNISMLRATDPVLFPLPLSDLTTSLRTIGPGVVFK